jgi:long-subunit acyl-CoA synthetase (AMP-forming)/thioester reductase-like protein
MQVFREAFDATMSTSVIVVHPHIMVARAFDAYAGRPLLGEPTTGGSVRWYSYAQCGAAAELFAVQLRHSCRRRSESEAERAVVLCAANGVGWLVADWACALAGLPSIAIDASTAPASALSMAREAAQARGRDVGAVCVDAGHLGEWQAALAQACISDRHEEADRMAAKSGRPLAVDTYSTASARQRLVAIACTMLDRDATDSADSNDDAIDNANDVAVAAAAAAAAAAAEGSTAAGAAAMVAMKAVQAAALTSRTAGTGDAELVTCLFSFGSTGEPKHLWFDALSWAEWGERNPPASRRARAALSRRSVRVSCAALFAPLSHGLARRTAWGELLHGGRLGLCEPRGAGAFDMAFEGGEGIVGGEGGVGGVGGWLDQIRAFAPTTLSAAPRFYTLYQRRYEAELSKLGMEAELSKLGKDAEISGATANHGEHATPEALRKAALVAVRRLGGPRLRLVAVGGALVPPSLLAFLRECFGECGAGGGHAVVSDGYGMAEVPGGIARDGIPLPGVEVRIQLPLATGHYTGTGWGASDADAIRALGDDVGEILVKTIRGAIVGDRGAAALDADGWFHTGDLGRWIEGSSPGGPRRLQVLERMGFTVKLANGEFLAPQRAEAVYEEQCASVASCVLLARPGELAATAVVLLRNDVLGETRLPNMVLDEMRAAAAAAGLRSWEVPGRVLIDPGPWDAASGCSSTHGKVRRLAIARRHGLLPHADAGEGRNGSADDNVMANGSGSGSSNGYDVAGGTVNGSDCASLGEGGGSSNCSSNRSSSSSLVDQLIGFLSASSEMSALPHLPCAAVRAAEHGSGWWSALGGDSIMAAELLGAWEGVVHAANARSAKGSRASVDAPSVNAPSVNALGAKGSRSARPTTAHSQRAHSQRRPMISLNMHDLFSLTPRELRCKAQACLGRHGIVGDDERIGAKVEDEQEEDVGTLEEAELEEEAAAKARGNGGCQWEVEASASTTSAMAAAAAAAAAAATEAPATTPTTERRESERVPATTPTTERRESERVSAITGEGKEVDGPCVLLTGATGFLGPHLLSALLGTSAPQRWAAIAILARPPLERVTDGLSMAMQAIALGSGAGCEVGEAHARVRAFEADLSLPDLGLSASDRKALVQMRIQAVVHSGAVVDHARAYPAIQPTNVRAIAALLELVSPLGAPRLAPPPLFVFVSSMSVIPVAAATAASGWSGIPEALVPPTCAAALESAYAQSKLVAEHHLAHAAHMGRVRLSIARLGLLGPATHAQSPLNAPDRRDWLSLLLGAVDATGASPAGLTAGRRAVAVLPVDKGAAALAVQAAAALDTETGVGSSAIEIACLDAASFGLAPRSLSTLLDGIDASRHVAGLPPLRRELPYPQWRRLVAAAGHPAVLALAMLPPEGRGGSLRLPSGARRRLRDMQRFVDGARTHVLPMDE